MVIYIDVLLMVNLYINFLLTKSTALFLRRRISTARTVFSAIAGAAGALAILLPTMPVFSVMLFKTALGAVMTLIAFGKQTPADFLISWMVFLVVSFTFGGLMTALWNFVAPAGMIYENGITYFNIPIAALAGMAGAGYLTVKAVRFFSDKRIRCTELSKVHISAENAEVTLEGLPDTGCGLCDPFSGKPVIICRKDKADAVIPRNIKDYLNGISTDKIKLIPCSTVSSEALIPVFRPDTVTIDGRNTDVIVGITAKDLGEGIDCVFNPGIITL